MTKEELACVIDAVTAGNQSEYARLTGITGQQLRKLLAGTSGISGQTETIARLLLLLKEKKLLDVAKKSLHCSALCATLNASVTHFSKDRKIMNSTTDFDEWLDAADPCDAPNVAGLVEAVRDECEFSGFKAERAPNGKLIVSADHLDLKLVLVSKEAEEGFVRRIHARYVPSGMSAEIASAIDHLNDHD